MAEAGNEYYYKSIKEGGQQRKNSERRGRERASSHPHLLSPPLLLLLRFEVAPNFPFRRRRCNGGSRIDLKLSGRTSSRRYPLDPSASRCPRAKHTSNRSPPSSLPILILLSVCSRLARLTSRVVFLAPQTENLELCVRLPRERRPGEIVLSNFPLSFHSSVLFLIPVPGLAHDCVLRFCFLSLSGLFPRTPLLLRL